ncbi:hypothetical protein BpHYR1_025096 [Brachionus plicatilis]|uniref:Uncharacterized protein n=1 Tax=Brachionus plicatilis TaxID=10195 RepID=A0A3M7RGP9_BRAPC|nr:hypothetical protein BpHYR1_025096 [Brachionus plicatilis]
MAYLDSLNLNKISRICGSSSKNDLNELDWITLIDSIIKVYMGQNRNFFYLCDQSNGLLDISSTIFSKLEILNLFTFYYYNVITKTY